MIDFKKYENPLPYASFDVDSQAFDMWANRNDRLQEEFVEDMFDYMMEVLTETDDVEVDVDVMNKLYKITDIIINEKDTYEEMFWFALELLPLVV
jgi:hypothetical protein